MSYWYLKGQVKTKHSCANLSYLFVLCTLSLNALGQEKAYKGLLDTVFKYSGLFVGVKPIEQLRLNHKRMWRYAEDLKGYSGATLDTAIVLQIIINSSNPDTTLWSEQELPKLIIIHNPEEEIFISNLSDRFGLTDKKSIRNYRKQITEFNQSDSFDRNIYYFSRPVFDNSGKFAIVQYNNAHSGLGGRGAITLYELINSSWIEIGPIVKWGY